MKLTRSVVKECLRERAIQVVGPGQFATEPAGEIEDQDLLTDPRYSLYCFDPENDEAIFVECDDPEAVDRSAFYYQGQAEHAKALITIPLARFHELAEQIPWPEKGLIFAHSVGRCGSTLISKALAALPQLHSLSEPDDIEQMVNMRGDNTITKEWLHQNLRAAAKWRCKPRAGGPFEAVAIKPRAEAMALIDDFAVCFPNDRHFFIYRNAISWMATAFKNFPHDRDVYDKELNQTMEDRWATTLPLVVELRKPGEPMNPVQVRIVGWITGMEGYVRLYQAVPTSAAIRFEDIETDSESTIKNLFAHLKIDIEDWDAMRRVLSEDSQAGTIYDREERKKATRPLTPDLLQDIKDLVASRPSLGTSDVILPGTL